ncbi:hypothetical protein [Amycolatopsis sp. NPDC058986]|uniref:hypothetical protein n=1 Tax=unclassified Amycolatopsis TaxID=2618356 RepID=UPI00366AF7BA
MRLDEFDAVLGLDCTRSEDGRKFYERRNRAEEQGAVEAMPGSPQPADDSH